MINIKHTSLRNILNQVQELPLGINILFNVPPSLKLRRTRSNPSLTAFTLRSFSEGGFSFIAKLTYMYYVYILLCNDNTYYTGCTEDLKARFERHCKGYVDSTMGNLPVKLVYYCAFDDKYKA